MAEFEASTERPANASPAPTESSASPAPTETDGGIVRRGNLAPCFVLMPALVGLLGAIWAGVLLNSKWEALEEVRGGPLLFSTSNLTEFISFSNSRDPTWASVFAPTILAEIVGLCFASAALAHASAGAASVMQRNALLHHGNALCQSALMLIFQGLLVLQLSRTVDSWLAVFVPIYIGAFAQLALHFSKTVDVRGRRTGFPFSYSHLMLMIVSFKLTGALRYDEATWQHALWPLWLVCSVVGAMVLLGVCALPGLLRRERQARTSLVLLSLLLLLTAGSVVVPALMGLLRLTDFLDGMPLYARAPPQLRA